VALLWWSLQAVVVAVLPVKLVLVLLDVGLLVLVLALLAGAPELGAVELMLVLLVLVSVLVVLAVMQLPLVTAYSAVSRRQLARPANNRDLRFSTAARRLRATHELANKAPATRSGHINNHRPT
jgi:hypothetical protein